MFVYLDKCFCFACLCAATGCSNTLKSQRDEDAPRSWLLQHLSEDSLQRFYAPAGYLVMDARNWSSVYCSQVVAIHVTCTLHLTNINTFFFFVFLPSSPLLPSTRLICKLQRSSRNSPEPAHISVVIQRVYNNLEKRNPTVFHLPRINS